MNCPAVAAGLAKRGVTLDAARFESLERERKDIQTRTQDLQAKRNALSKAIGAAKGKGEDASALMTEVAGIGAETKRLEGELDRVQAALRDFLLDLPNLTHPSVPVGKSLRRQRRSAPLGHAAHVRLPGARPHGHRRGLGLLDFATGAKLSGARFTFLRGGLARLHRALAQFMLDVQTTRARLHRVLHAVHRQRRNARRHDAAAQVRSRHVRGEEGRRRSRRSGGGRAPVPHLDGRDHADQLGARRDPAGRGAAASS